MIIQPMCGYFFTVEWRPGFSAVFEAFLGATEFGQTYIPMHAIKFMRFDEMRGIAVIENALLPTSVLMPCTIGKGIINHMGTPFAEIKIELTTPFGDNITLKSYGVIDKQKEI